MVHIKAFRSDNGDIRETPAYGILEASHYLRIPLATLRSWVVGRHYPTESGKKFFRPIIIPSSREESLLSFTNLVEVHVLDAIRWEHEIPLKKIRIALDYLKKKVSSRHPLVDQSFETHGLDLFVQKYGQLINVSEEGQLAMRNLLQAHLHRVERDQSGLPVKLYPFTRKRLPNEPMLVVIDPYISFGRPVVVGTGIPTDVIAERYKAGESIGELAADYSCKGSAIEEAIRCELQLKAA